MVVNERIRAVFKPNWPHTLTYWIVFFSFGLCLGFLGPTLLDLRCQTQSTLQEITSVFFSQQFFLLIGSSVGGVFTKTQICALSALFVSTLLISVVFATVPLCNHVLLLAIPMAVAGLSMGVIDTISNFQLVKTYQKDSAVFLQVLHFFIGLGALVSPLIVDPFLSETNCLVGNRTENGTKELDHLRNMLVGKHAHNLSHYHLPTQGDVVTQVSYAFWIMAIINTLRKNGKVQLPVPVLVFALIQCEKTTFCCRTSSPRLLDQDGLTMKNLGSGEPDPKSLQAAGHGNLFSNWRNGEVHGLSLSYCVICVLGGLVLFMTDGLLGAYSVFIYTYAVAPPISLSHKTAGYLSSVFWAAITAGRLVSIPMSCRVRPVIMLTVNLAGMIITLLLLLVICTSSAFLFVGTFFLGLFLSSIFPCMLAYTEDILEYQGCTTTVLVTGAGMGEMVLQVLVGSIIHSKGNYSFLLCDMIIGCIGFTLFFALLLSHHMCR
ncbi:hypothetical protein JZ751_017348 [Albula glossodonta]|uniref:Uncharacterized protein n=1 Tax=Albula glossodonta TaxID=121402 RepID=A0A8T2PNE9_9TELE|nr:hypothetical protein JZ751_017348 [Albula glossodonta]